MWWFIIVAVYLGFGLLAARFFYGSAMSDVYEDRAACEKCQAQAYSGKEVTHHKPDYGLIWLMSVAWLGVMVFFLVHLVYLGVAAVVKRIVTRQRIEAKIAFERQISAGKADHEYRMLYKQVVDMGMDPEVALPAAGPFPTPARTVPTPVPKRVEAPRTPFTGAPSRRRESNTYTTWGRQSYTFTSSAAEVLQDRVRQLDVEASETGVPNPDVDALLALVRAQLEMTLIRAQLEGRETRHVQRG